MKTSSIATMTLAFAIAALSHAQSEPKLGFLASPPEEAAKLPTITLKARSDWRRPVSVDLTPQMPPVQNQGGQGSCVAWATAYACFSAGVGMRMKHDIDLLKDTAWEFSPAFIYHLRKDTDHEGMTIHNAMNILKQYGCATLKDMPYDDKDDKSQPGDAALKHALKFQVKPNQEPALLACRGQKEVDVEEMKDYIARTGRPFVLGITLFRDWPFGLKSLVDPGFVYKPATTSTLGGHAMTVVGYDDDKHAFRILNSWGPNWADHGYIWVSEDYVKDSTVEAWGFAPGGLKARSVAPNTVLFPKEGIEIHYRS